MVALPSRRHTCSSQMRQTTCSRLRGERREVDAFMRRGECAQLSGLLASKPPAAATLGLTVHALPSDAAQSCSAAPHHSTPQLLPCICHMSRSEVDMHLAQSSELRWHGRLRRVLGGSQPGAAFALGRALGARPLAWGRWARGRAWRAAARAAPANMMTQPQIQCDEVTVDG